MTTEAGSAGLSQVNQRGIIVANNKKSKGHLADEPDTFISFSDKLSEIIVKFKIPIGSVLVVALLAGLIDLALKSQSTTGEMKAQSAYYVLQKEYLDKKEELTTEEVPAEIQPTKAPLVKPNTNKNTAKQNAKASDETEKKVTTKTIDEPIEKGIEANYGDLPHRYAQFIGKHSKSIASYAASIELAQLFLSYDKKEEAKDLLNSVVTDIKDDSVFFGLVKTQLGTILTSLGKYQEAISEFDAIVNSTKQISFHSDALLRLGLAYEGMDDLKKAKQMYRRLNDDFSKTSAGRSAKNYLRLISYKEGATPSVKE